MQGGRKEVLRQENGQPQHRRGQQLHSVAMLVAALLLLLLPHAALAAAGNNNIKIIAWYGAGNLSKSEYGRDTILLFNPTQASITMNQWSLQTGGTDGSFTKATYLLPTVTIPAGGFYAIAGSGPSYISSSGCVSKRCNTTYAYDYQLQTLEGTASATQNSLSSTAVTVALVNNQQPLGTCPLTSSALVDVIGIGASDGSSPVTCFAGKGYATYTPSTLNGTTTNINGVVYAYATVRRNRCVDTFDNANDWILGFIDFANSKSTPTPCGTGAQLSVSATAAPSNPGILDPFTLMASVVPAGNTRTLNVSADLSNLGLSDGTQLYDDGTHGDVTAGDRVFSLKTAATTGDLGSVPGLIVSATDNAGNLARNLLPLTLVPGTLAMTADKTSATVHAGDVVTFKFSVAGQHGYGGTLQISCTGSPNANTLGVPISTQCVSTPSQISIDNNGSGMFSLVVATGTTFSAGATERNLLLAVLSVATGLCLFLRRRAARAHLVRLAAFCAVITFALLSLSACATNAGIGNTAAAPGTYTYTVRAQDTAVPTITNSMPLTVTVQ